MGRKAQSSVENRENAFLNNSVAIFHGSKYKEKVKIKGHELIYTYMHRLCVHIYYIHILIYASVYFSSRFPELYMRV